MTERTVAVRAGGGYEAVIGAGLLARCGEKIAAVCGNCRAAVVTDGNLAELYLPTVLASLSAAGIAAESCVFPAGEAHKNMETLSAVLEFLAERRFVRSDVVVALGGGVTGDMAGFAAACYLRGVRYVQLPTSLLAAVDSSVGGKTAVDLAAGKNLAGAFKQPALVLCDTDTLRTLPPAEFANGSAEAIKTGVLFDRKVFDAFARPRTDEMLADVIEACIRYKAGVVERDEFDLGERRKLNLGHTIGHAIEKCSGYTVAHGHAVAAGMAMIARAGERKGLTEPGTAAEIEAMLRRCDLPTDTEYGVEALADAALADKKRMGGTITLVIPEEIGRCTLRTEPVECLRDYVALGKGD